MEVQDGSYRFLREKGDSRMKRLKVMVFLCLLLILCLAGCSKKKSDRPEMNIDFVQGKNGESLKKMDGTYQYTFSVEDDDYYDVGISVTKESGSLSVTITRDEDGKKIYTGTDLPTSEFTVHADEVGHYKVLFTADNFVGDYSCDLSHGTN